MRKLHITRKSLARVFYGVATAYQPFVMMFLEWTQCSMLIACLIFAVGLLIDEDYSKR